MSTSVTITRIAPMAMITHTHIGVSGAGGGGWWLRRFRLSLEAEYRTPLARRWLGSHNTPEVGLVALHGAGELVGSGLDSCRYQRTAHISIL